MDDAYVGPVIAESALPLRVRRGLVGVLLARLDRAQRWLTANASPAHPPGAAAAV